MFTHCRGSGGTASPSNTLDSGVTDGSLDYSLDDSGARVSGPLHVRCSVEVDADGQPVSVACAGQVWTVDVASPRLPRHGWLHPAGRSLWRVTIGNAALELYAREYARGAPGLTWWWLVVPRTALASLHMQLDASGRLVTPA